MVINYSTSVLKVLSDIVNYVESMNTYGAGDRWLLKLELFLQKSLRNPSTIKLCNSRTFYNKGLRCIQFNDWVIGFTFSNNEVLIEAIIHSSNITD